ncbi:hypothetical protein ACLIA0_10475 [Bacillaceae bacterium W0354]
MKKWLYVLLAIIIIILGLVIFYFRTITFGNLISEVYNDEVEIAEMLISHTIIGEYAEIKELEEQTRVTKITDKVIIKDILEESVEMELRVSKSNLVEYFITLTNVEGEKVVLYMGDDIISNGSKYYKIKSDNKLMNAINRQELEWDITYH